ncbi:MAG: AI-2E family transporter [Gemmatimonadaceae bacterium]|nr:AI-2E family transporter [Gemmatimonadaceae bacterium]
MPTSAVAPEGLRRFRFAPVLAGTVITVLLLLLFRTVADVLLLLFLGILLSLYLRAVADWIERRAGMPPRLALTAGLLLTVLGLAGFVAMLVPPIVQQTQQLVTVLPEYITAWETSLERLILRFGPLRDLVKPGEHRILFAVYNQVSAQFGDVVPKVFGIVHGAISIFSVGVMGIYLSLHPALYREWLIALFPPIHRDLVRDVLGDLGETLRSWIVAQLLGMTILGALTALGLYLLDVPFFLAFGVFTGLVAIVPFFGTLVSTLLPALFVLGTPGGGTRALLVIGLGTVIHVLESNVIHPVIISKKVDLPPVLSIMAVLVMGKLLGAAGLLVAVPTLAVTMVLVRRILITRIYEGQGFRKTTRDRTLVLRLPVPDGGVIPPVGERVDVIGFLEAGAQPVPAAVPR